MSVRRTTLLGLLAALALPAAADKLDKDSKKWLEEVAPIVLPEEKQTYGELKDRAERAEFEKIFWARRDTNLETPENEYKTSTFDPRRAEADKRFKVAGKYGAQTDCGRLFVLFGEPDEVKKEPSDNPVPRPPETWTYRDRPGMTFKGGETKVSLDGECKLANPNAARELDRVAGNLVVNPNLAYKVVAGKITRLADLLPKPSPAQTLLKTPREDFPVAAQQAFVRAADGSTVILGLVKADAAALTVADEGGAKVAHVTVAAQVVDAEGRPKAFDERAVVAPVGADGSVVAGYRMFVKPGSYTLKFGLVDDKSGKGSLGSEAREVPALAGGELTGGTLLVLSDIEEETEKGPDGQCRDKASGQFATCGEVRDSKGRPARKLGDPQDPLGAFELGKSRLVPRFGNAFTTSESPIFFYTGSDGAVDAATGKPSVTVGLSLSKGPKMVAKAPEADFTESVIAGSVGPVPLEKYEPGTYTAKVKFHDNVSKKDVVVEANVEIRK